MRHALLVALTLALGPVAADGFRAWAEPSPAAPVGQPKPVTLAEVHGLGKWVPTPSQTLEWHGPGPLTVGQGPCYETLLGHGPGYAIIPGGTAPVKTAAIGFEPSK